MKGKGEGTQNNTEKQRFTESKICFFAVWGAAEKALIFCWGDKKSEVPANRAVSGTPLGGSHF
jgi:hypothetical protein